MKWKDFLHYQRGSRLAVILLLILIVLTLILNSILLYRNPDEIVISQNDSLIREFDAFRRTLKERVPASSETGTDEERAEFSPGSVNPSREMTTREKEVPGRQFTPYPGTEKLSVGETITLNETDTAQWKKIPGIGSSYASRIVRYRELLGGYVRLEQLLEVYGMDNELYNRIVPYISSDANYRKIKVNELEFKELLRHPYLNYKQVQAIVNLRRRKGNIVSINELGMLDEFTSEDIYRLEPYLEF
ncbi:MAG: helix-hairpin-helix domain-containing protein [Proteiniphilum sp.]